MRVAAVLVCAITAVLGISIDLEIELDYQGCPVDHSIQKIFPHKYCNMFNLCSNGHIIEFHCTRNLLFNVETLECDWYYNVDCAGRNISESRPEENAPEDETEVDNDTCNCDPAEAPEICSRPESNGVLVAHEYCTRFYICFDSQPVALRCPKNLTFNPYKNRCDWAENVDCGNRTMPETDDEDDEVSGGDNPDDDEDTGPGNDDPAKAAEICAEEKSNGELVAHEYCNWYYKCSNGQTIEMKCPTDLVFNPRRNRCDWPSNVDCNRTIFEPEEDDNSVGENPEDDEDTGPGNDDPTKAAEICAQNNTDGVLVAHENCDEFYTCNLYVPLPVRCVSGLLFNPRNNRCDWPEKVDCGDRVIPERNETQSEDESEQPCKNCDPSEAPEICALEGSEGILVAHEHCNQYFKCLGGRPSVQRCMNTLLYNAHKGWCDWPEQVDCGDRIIPGQEDDESDTTDASAICARSGNEGLLVAHEQCNQYYKCDHGEAFEAACQSGLLFNPTLRVCDWPFNVDCGDREQ